MIAAVRLTESPGTGKLTLLRTAPNTFVQSSNIRVGLDPVVQSIVSLTISLRHKFVKQISAKVTNTLLFFVENVRILCTAKDFHIFSTKNNSVFVILMFEILTKR